MIFERPYGYTLIRESELRRAQARRSARTSVRGCERPAAAAPKTRSGQRGLSAGRMPARQFDDAPMRSFAALRMTNEARNDVGDLRRKPTVHAYIRLRAYSSRASRSLGSSSSTTARNSSLSISPTAGPCGTPSSITSSPLTARSRTPKTG